jgi:MraZ protein
MFANAADCEPDGQGRILIPTLLRKYASLEKEVVVVGSFDRVEIWNAQRWAELETAAFDSGALEKAMEELGL